MVAFRTMIAFKELPKGLSIFDCARPAPAQAPEVAATPVLEPSIRFLSALQGFCPLSIRLPE